MEPTITWAFARTVASQEHEVALRWPVSGPGGERTWADRTWGAYADAACRAAAGLAELGLRRSERVALMLPNRGEFHAADMGTLLAGGTPVSVYNSSAPEGIAHVLRHSGAHLAVVDTQFSDRMAKARAAAPDLERVVWVGDGPDLVPGDARFEDLLATPPLDLEAAAASGSPGDLITLIYTSGTTGPPKGVMLTQSNLAFTVGVYARVLGRSLRGLRQVSYLPMAHIAERLATHYFHACQGSVVTCCPALTDLGATMAEVQPEWFFSAPRLWEKLQAGIEATVAADPSRAEGFARARKLGWEVFLADRDDGGAPEGLRAEWETARAEHVTPALEQVGLGRVLIALTGAAPMPRHTTEFFLSAGVPLSEVWGMSETSGTGTWSPHRIVPGTTGKPLEGVEIRLGDDDEIFVRGPCVFAGYLGDDHRTAEVLDSDGWLRTGDVGAFDDDGNLRIVDRIKEIIVPSSGHNVSPSQLEAKLKESPLIGQACVVGTGRPHVAALLVLDPDQASVWARSRGLGSVSLADLSRHPDLLVDIASFLDSVNTRVARSERIVAYTVLADDWRPDSDILTPTSKLKRRAVEARYAGLIDELYSGAESVARSQEHRRIQGPSGAVPE